MSTDLTATNSGGQVGFSFNPFNRDQALTIREWATDMAYSDLVPDIYRIKPDPDPEKTKLAERKAVANCMIALNMAMRIGAEPLMVMQNMYIVHGRPAWSSKFLISTVNTCGKYTSIEYKQEIKGKVGILTLTRYISKILPGENQRKKVPEDYNEERYADLDNVTMVAYCTDISTGKTLISSEVSIKMAVLEGWYDKDGSKWKTMQEKMLRYRAASFWVNEYAPELSMGMRTQEEIEDVEKTEDIEYSEVSSNIKRTIDEKANKKSFDFDGAKDMTADKPAEESKPEETKPEVKPEEPKQDPKPEVKAEEKEKPADTLAKVGQENQAKADAGVQAPFGFPAQK